MSDVKGAESLTGRAVFIFNDMSSSLGRSTDTLGSPRIDPSVGQYPFPQSNSLERHGSSGYYGARRNSAASSITSIGGVLDSPTQGVEIGKNGMFCRVRQQPVKLTSYHTAISTLLQPPIVRTGLLPHAAGPSAPKPPSTRDIPPVTLSNIPQTDSKSFEQYLSKVGSLYDAFQRAKEGIEDGGLGLSRKLGIPSQAAQPSGLLIQGQQRRPSSNSEATATSPLEIPPSRRRGAGGSARRILLPATQLSTIPNVYFEQNFHLENPRTFDIVSERSEIVRPTPGSSGGMMSPGSGGRKVLATNAILQEKLSWYMDTVEVHLISSISKASSSFFTALGSLRELHLEAASSVAKIQALRQDLSKLDRDMAIGGLKIVAMRRRKENMRKLGDAVAQLTKVVELMTSCEERVDKGDFEDALRGLSHIEKLIRGQKEVHPADRVDWKPSYADDRLIDLRGVKALEGIWNDISYLKSKIGKGFESRFLEALLADLRQHVDIVPSAATFQRWDRASQRFRTTHSRNPSAFPAYLHLADSLRSMLISILDGLSQSESLMPATISYREAVLLEIKTLVRRHLPSSSDDDNESTMSVSTQGARRMTQADKSSILARNLRALDSEDFEDLLKKMYSNVGEALRRLGTQVKVVLDITSSFDGPLSGAKSAVSSPTKIDGNPKNAPMISSSGLAVQQEDIQQALDMSHLLGQAVDIAQAQITKILKVRTEQNTSLPLHRFLRYFHLNRLFADECEAVSGRSGTALKTVVNAHIKDFVAQFADVERHRLLQGMDADRWDAKDFGDPEVQILNRILEGSTRDIEAWTKSCVIWEDDAMNPTGGLDANRKAENGDGPPKDKIRTAVIDEQKYILPESAFIVLRGLEKFENLVAGIPSMTQDITSFLLEYLGLFNSRSQQLILGAGATRIAGLKNITTKHLALASQALSFVAALTPHVREFVRRHSSGSGGLMTEFDKMKREYQEHQAGINDKLVDIMTARATTHVGNMKKVNWDVDDPTLSKSVNGYMEVLVKESMTLHKVLSRHLPDMTVRMIMDPVFGSYKEQFGQAFRDLEIRSASGKER